MYKSFCAPVVTLLVLTTLTGSQGRADSRETPADSSASAAPSASSTSRSEAARPAHQMGELNITAVVHQPQVTVGLNPDEVTIDGLTQPTLDAAYQPWLKSHREYRQHRDQWVQFRDWMRTQRLAAQKGQLDSRFQLRREAKRRLKSLHTPQPRTVARTLIQTLYQGLRDVQTHGAMSTRTQQALDAMSDSLADVHQQISHRLRKEETTHQIRLRQILLEQEALSGEARLVLAQLHAQQSKERFTESQNNGQTTIPERSLGPDFTPAIQLLEELVKEQPEIDQLDSVLYLLGEYLSSEGTSQTPASIHSYRQLIERFPNSSHAASAHFRVGRYEFHHHRNFVGAASHFNAVLERQEPQGRLDKEALYYLAWSQHNQAHVNRMAPYQAAISTWTRFLNDHGQQTDAIASGMTDEAIQMTAIALFDLSNEPQSGLKTIQALANAWQNGDHQFEVYRALLQLLSDNERNQETIDLADTMLKQWPLSPHNPTIHWMLIEKLTRDPSTHPDRIDSELQAFSVRFAPDSPWTKANRKQTNALILAKEQWAHITMERAASQITAGWERDPANPLSGNRSSFRDAKAHYTEAAAFLRALIEQQPDTLTSTPETYRTYADVLYRLGHHHEALNALSALQQAGAMTPETWSLQLRVLEQQLPAQFGAIGALPAGPEMAPEFQKLIQTIDVLASQRPFQDIEWPFNAALVLHQHGQFQESRPRWMDIIENPQWKDEPLRAKAAHLVVESHILEGQLDRAQERASFFSEMDFAEDSVEAQERYFTLIGNQSHLPQAAVLQAQANRLERAHDAQWRTKAQEAVAAYEAILNQKDRPQFRDLEAARLSALALHRSLGNSVEVRAHIDALLNEQPNHPQRVELRRIIAESYMAQLDYDNAIIRLEELYADLQSANSKHESGLLSLRTAAWLRQGLGQHQQAAENYERFGRDNPTHPEAGDSMFWAGRLWEQVSTGEAIAFYTRFIESPLNASADTRMHAHLRLAALESDGTDSVTWTLSLETAYLELQKELHPHHPAHGLRDHDQIDRLIGKMDELLDFELGTEAAVNLRQLAARKKAFDRFIRKAAAFWDHGTHSFESKSRLWTEIGDRWLLLAEKTEAHLDHLIPESFAVDALSKDIFVVEIYSYMVQPFRNSATAYYEQTLQFGQQGQWWSPWQIHSANALHRAWPTEHPIPQVDWTPTRGEILMSIASPDPQGPVARAAQYKAIIEGNSHNLDAYAELVRAHIDQGLTQPLLHESSWSHAWSLIQIAEAQIPAAKTHPALQFQQARLYELEGYTAAATPIWEEILDITPEHAPTAAAMGVHFLEQKHLPRALELIEQALADFPGSVPLRLAQAHAYYDMGQPDAALEALGQAQSILPHSIDIVVARATVHGILHRDRDQALAILQPLKNDNGHYPEAAQQLMDQMNQNALRVQQLDEQQQVETDVAQRAEEAARILREAEESSDGEIEENGTVPDPGLPPLLAETKESIGETFQHHRNDVQHCYRLALKEQPDLSGTLVLGMDIEDGMATHVRVEGLNQGIQDCIHQQSTRWRFGPIVSASAIEIRFTLQTE